MTERDDTPEAELPPKPTLAVPTDEEVEAEDAPGAEDVPEESFLASEQAAVDDTVDDVENDAG
jgi:hypothetical protein